MHSSIVTGLLRLSNTMQRSFMALMHVWKAQNSSVEHAMQASAAVELPAANQAAALVEVRTATDAAEASCLNLEEPGLAQPEKVKTGPTSGVAPAKARGKTGTAFPIVQVLLLASKPAYLHHDSHMQNLVYSHAAKYAVKMQAATCHEDRSLSEYAVVQLAHMLCSTSDLLL